jgi:hypothetical protein
LAKAIADQEVKSKGRMTYSPRTFLLDPDDTLYRLARVTFSRMFDDPQSCRLPRFAGQRVRMVEAIVAVHARKPQAVVRLVYQMLEFDGEGRLDREAFIRQNAAIWSVVGERVLRGLVAKEPTIVEASSRFVARGGQWQPTPALERRIQRAALGELQCARL